MPQAAIPIAAEAAVATTLTAAEIAAAEAAAAAAAEAAAVAAAEQAAAAAATEAATTAAAEQAATQAAAQAAAQTTPSGIELLQPITTPVTPPTVNPAMPPANYGYTGAPPPAAPPPPPIEPLPINETFSGMPQTVDPAGGFDTPGFESADYLKAQGYSGPVNTSAMNTQFPGNNLPSFQNVQPMSYPQTMINGVQPVSSANTGIDALAKEVIPNAFTAGPTAGEAAVNATNQSILQSTSALPGPMAGPPAPGLTSIGSGMSEQNKVMSEIYDRIAPQTTVSGETVYPQTIGTSAPTPEAGGIQSLFNQGLDYAKKNPLTTAMFANTAYNYLNQPKPYEPKKYKPTFKPGLYTGYQPVQPTPYQPNYAHGGLADLGGYSDYARGGRMLKGPGDGMSDDIPATIAGKQPARLANEEFVVPADVVSHLGNGSSEAGAKVLYKMMDRVRQARTGNKKQGKQINPEKYLA